MRPLALAVPTLLLAAILGCGDRNNREVGGVNDTTPAPEAMTPEAPEAAPGLRDFSFEQRQDFAASVRQQLAGIDEEIDELASQAKSAGGAVSDRALARIRSSRQAVNRNLSRVESATAATWSNVQNAVSTSVENLEEAIEVAQPK